MALDSLPQTRMIEYKSEHDLYIARVMRERVVELRCDSSYLWQVSPGHAREIVMLHVVTSIVKYVIDGSIV